MRTLSASLTTAQKSPSSSPYFEVKIEDKLFSILRLAFTRLYTGSEPQGYHALALPGDGSLNRARIDPTTNTLYRQRVTSPGPGSDFTPWTSVATTAAGTTCAMSARLFNVILFWVDNVDNTKINYQESTNWGLSWGATQSIQTSAPVTYLSCAYEDASYNVVLFYNAGAAVVAIKRTAGAWGSPVSWTNSLSSLTGLAAIKETATNLFDLVVAGVNTATTKRGLYSCTYDQPAASWSALQTVAESESSSLVTYKSPFLSKPDTWRLSFVEKFTGTTAYTYSFLSHTAPNSTFAECLWKLPSPFNYSSDYGISISFSGSYAWLTSPDGVWQSPLAPAPQDVSSSVLSLSIDTDEEGGKTVVELANDSGQFNAFAKLGHQLTINLGYRSTAGAEVSTGLAYQIVTAHYLSAGAKATLTLIGGDPGIIGGVFKARHQITWTSGQKSISQIIKTLLAYMGVELEILSQSSLAQNHQPPFTLRPGDAVTTALRRLLGKCPDVLLYRGGKALMKNPLSADTADYAYLYPPTLPTHHAILEGRYTQKLPEANWAQAFNATQVNQAFTWTEVDKGYARLKQVHDINLSLSETQSRANAELREAEINSRGDTILVPLNCGQELYDVVDITDSRVALQSQKRRVLGLRHTFTYPRGDYRLKLALGNA